MTQRHNACVRFQSPDGRWWGAPPGEALTLFEACRHALSWFADSHWKVAEGNHRRRYSVKRMDANNPKFDLKSVIASCAALAAAVDYANRMVFNLDRALFALERTNEKLLVRPKT